MSGFRTKENVQLYYERARKVLEDAVYVMPLAPKPTLVKIRRETRITNELKASHAHGAGAVLVSCYRKTDVVKAAYIGSNVR